MIWLLTLEILLYPLVEEFCQDALKNTTPKRNLKRMSGALMLSSNTNTNDKLGKQLRILLDFR